MPIPATINDLSLTPASNSPVGNVDGPATLDNYQRQHASFIAELRDSRTALGSSTTAAQGAALVGYNSTLTYLAGSVGKAIKDFSTVLVTKTIDAVKSVAALPAGGDTGISFEGDVTAYDVYEGAIGPGAIPLPVIDGIASAVRSPPVTDVLSTNAIAGYVQNRTPQNFLTGFQGAVSLFGVGISDADNTSTWGLATICSDKTNQAISTGIGRSLFNEMDFNVCSPATLVSGLILGGTWLVQPSSATGVTVFKPKGTALLDPKWQYAFGTQDGATLVGGRFGMQAATGNSVSSQELDMFWSTSAGLQRFTSLQATDSGMILTSNAAPNGTTTPGSLILLNGAFYLRPITAPNTPVVNSFVLYIDAADNRLKAKSGAGTITTLALQ